MSNVVDVVVADRNLATMLRGVKAAGLEAELSQKGPYTIFAPTDLAFGKLEAGHLESFLKPENKEKLIELLKHHVVEELIAFSDLKDGQHIPTANGRDLNVRVVDGKVSINGAVVQGRDSSGTNGIVHSLDTVIEMK
jgi:uncharacterized surface protein with fasciclin (FAS1) repeats